MNQLELLENLYVPQAVYDEVTQVGKPEGEKLRRFLKSRVKKVDLSITKLGLGIDALEAITLNKMLDADVLLIDDNRAKKYAV